jgi:hypothetical protein
MKEAALSTGATASLSVAALAGIDADLQIVTSTSSI